METIGERVTRLRNDLGLTQDQLAKNAGVAQSTINGVEKGARQKMPSSLIEIAHALGVDAYWLKTGGGKCALKYSNTHANSASKLSIEESKPANIVSMPSSLIKELNEVANRINDAGLNRLIERAAQLAIEFPKASKGNAAQ